jgi:ELWxxDGT repeat protein
MLGEISSRSKNFVNVNGHLFYSASDSLMMATPASAPILVSIVGEPILAIYNITLGPSFFFVTQSGSNQKLWRSDGTSANTIAMITHPQVTPLLTYNSQVFLRVNSVAYGVELWKVDAAYNVSLLKDINPGSPSGFVGDLVINSDWELLYFFANAGTGVDLWRSDGTTTGTVAAVDLDDNITTSFYGFHGLTSVNDKMYFAREYSDWEYGDEVAELWKTTGSPETTSLVVRYITEPRSYNFISHLLAFNGKLYFFHRVDDPAHNYVTVSDGSAAGTEHLHLSSIDGAPRRLIDAGSHLLFYAEGQSFTSPIEKSDGITASTVHQFSIFHSASDETISLTSTEGRAFFTDDIGGYYGGGDELWQADLSTGVTQPLKEIFGSSFGRAGNIVANSGSIFFTRKLPGDMQLWYYDPDAPAPCAGNGSIEREKWDSVAGAFVSSIPVHTPPTSVTTLTSFTTTRNEGDNYGARVRGYVCVPESGNYTFYISSDDRSELWLSTDDHPANKRLIASTKWTLYNEWTKYPSQQSAAIALEAGRKYYIEALHKEGSGADHLSVGWRLPNGTLERPIPGVRLIPYSGIAPEVAIMEPSEEATFFAPADIDLAATAQDEDGAIVKVAFYSGSNLLSEDTTQPYVYVWQDVPAGNYTIEARAYDDHGNIRSDFRTVTVAPPACAGTGIAYREVWLNVPGTDVQSFDFSAQPATEIIELNRFETTQSYNNDYASRIRGYLCVPQSGNYTLWISSDGESELYLSTDESPGNINLIAWVYGYTPFRNYDKYPSQRSVPIQLEAGRKYYIEARHKEARGNDFISVGWQLPDGVMERPIPGNRLIDIAPAGGGMRTARQVIASGDKYSSESSDVVSIYPNPISGEKQLSLNLPLENGADVRVVIQSVTGATVQSDHLFSTGTMVNVDLRASIPPGLYLVRATSDKRNWSLKLEVK